MILVNVGILHRRQEECRSCFLVALSSALSLWKNHKLPFYSRSSFVLQPHIFPPLVRESTDGSMQTEHACIVHRPLSQQCVTSVTLCAWVGKTTLVRSKGAAAVKRCLQQFKMRNDNQAYRKGLKGSIDGCWNKLIHGRDSSENTPVSVEGSDLSSSLEIVLNRDAKKKKKRTL